MSRQMWARRWIATRAAPVRPLAASYDPAAVERDWYGWWRDNGLFTRDAAASTGKDYTVLWPPANVTGSLHIGHALTASIQDALVRWRRMCGDRVSWIPGMDHAGIATQAVVERKLYQESRTTRHDLGRERMQDEIWKWCRLYGGKINQQLQLLGAAMDWEREYFTLDATRSQFVEQAFVRLFEQKLVYRALRMVNWCCHLRTVISDVEIDAVPLTGRTKLMLPGRAEPVEFGVLEHFIYPTADGSGEPVVVATTRLETMLGDAAVAVHPHDLRYRHLHGKFVLHPISGRQLPIVTDALLVDPAVGTGAVKVTPAHDPSDYECAQRHGLPLERLLNNDGTMTATAGPAYAGMDRYEARKRVRVDLQARGLYLHAQDHPMVLSLCSRSGDVLEPMLQPQWFVRMDTLASAAVKAVDSGRLQILPEHFGADWYRWLQNSRDWCISRQLWWGHRVPAYRVLTEMTLPAKDPLPAGMALVHESADASASPVLWVVAASTEVAQTRVRQLLGDSASFSLQQDDDVLDTWFSSGLLPLSAPWPKGASGSDIMRQRGTASPLDLLETGSDILFFWVARMVMLGMQLSDGQLPFPRVLLHSVVRDAQGRKMSKSLGNVIDPLHVIHGVDRATMEANLNANSASMPPAELKRGLDNVRKQFANGIAASGADALRLALVQYPQHARFLNMDMQRVTTARLFGNKLWNATRFVLNKVQPANGAVNPPSREAAASAALFDRWIMSRIAGTASAVQHGFDSFHLHAAANAAHNFLLFDLCDVYIEAFKDMSNASGQTLLLALDSGLRFMHPFMPFVTEELWQHVVPAATAPDTSRAHSISIASFPSPSVVAHLRDTAAESQVDAIKSIVHAVRSLRQTFKLPAGKAVPVVVSVANDASLTAALRDNETILKGLARAATLTLVDDGKHGAALARASVRVVSDRVRVGMPLDGVVDVRDQLERMRSRTGAVHTTLLDLQKRVSNPAYMAQVSEAVRDKDAAALAAAAADHAQLQRDIALLESMTTSNV